MKKKIIAIVILFSALAFLVVGGLDSSAANGRWISGSAMDWNGCSQVGTTNRARRTTFNFSVSRTSSNARVGSVGTWLSTGSAYTLTTWGVTGNKWGMVNTYATNHNPWFGA